MKKVENYIKIYPLYSCYKMARLSYALALIVAGCAGSQTAARTLEANSQRRLEVEVESRILVDGSEISRQTTKYSPNCEGTDVLMQRGSDANKYAELVRRRNCVADSGAQRFDYRDFTPTNKLEKGPRRREIILPDNTCLYQEGSSGWQKTGCASLERL